ncbi:hypothetical protein U1Q18_034991 [Sarracenia purpurea var. burkii]
MASSTDDEIAKKFTLLGITVYKDGRVERTQGTEIVPTSINYETGVRSKTFVIDPKTEVSVRLYIPKSASSDHRKLPLLVYFHGGAFCNETAFSPTYHYYLNALVAAANVVAVSVNYRRAPEFPLPTAYNDSWDAIKWVASHSIADGGVEVWLRNHADFDNVFFAGDSAGANIAHQMGMRVEAAERLHGFKLVGIVLVHPYFWGKEPIGAEAADWDDKLLVDGMWLFACPSSSGSDDPLINPVMDPKLSSVGCNKMLVCIAGKDLFRFRAKYYVEELKNSGWEGSVETTETAGQPHVFHLTNPTCKDAVALLKRVAAFLGKRKA